MVPTRTPTVWRQQHGHLQPVTYTHQHLGAQQQRSQCNDQREEGAPGLERSLGWHCQRSSGPRFHHNGRGRHAAGQGGILNRARDQKPRCAATMHPTHLQVLPPPLPVAVIRPNGTLTVSVGATVTTDALNSSCVSGPCNATWMVRGDKA